MYGTAAIPYDDESLQGLYENMGTTATCTMQGFFMYVCGSAAGFYYSSFSIYCYVVIINDFQKEKVVWVEKLIHLLVHIYPISIGIYLLVNKGFNNTNYGFCGNASYPLECEFEPDITCERGPQGPISRNIIDGIHAFLILFIPTVVTVGIFFRAKQQEHHFPAKIIGPQLCIYVVTVYYAILPFIVLAFIPKKKVYPFLIFAVLNYSLCGFWFMHVYRHFFSWIGKLFRRIQQQQQQGAPQQQRQQQLNSVGHSSNSSSSE